MKKKWMSFLKYGLLGGTVFSLVVFSGCSKDGEPKPTKNVWEQIQANSDLSMFATELQAEGFDVLLEGSGPYTVFAPDNAAMTTLLSTLGLSDFGSISTDVVDAVLSYHIVAGSYTYSSLTGDLTTVEGEKITVVSDGGENKLHTGASSDASVTTKDVAATNGELQVISTVIVPPLIGDLLIKTLGTVAQPLLLASDFTVFSAGIQKAEAYALENSHPALLGTLESPGILISESVKTVFAPSDAVFAAAELTADSFTGEQWYGLILAHTVSGDFHTAAKFTGAGQQITTLAGNKITVLTKDAPPDPDHGILTGIALDSNGDTTPEAQIAVLDVLAAAGASPANNGYINAIAGILQP